MNKLSVLLPLLLCLSSCEQGTSTPDKNQRNSDEPYQTEKINPMTASTVTYDNAGSSLADQTVQGAIDELAARAEGLGDPFDRITIESLSKESALGISSDAISVECPTTTGRTGRALGGACSVENGDGATLLATDVHDTWFECRWNKPKNSTPTLTAKVTCLSPAQ